MCYRKLCLLFPIFIFRFRFRDSPTTFMPLMHANLLCRLVPWVDLQMCVSNLFINGYVERVSRGGTDPKLCDSTSAPSKNLEEKPFNSAADRFFLVGSILFLHDAPVTVMSSLWWGFESHPLVCVSFGAQRMVSSWEALSIKEQPLFLRASRCSGLF